MTNACVMCGMPIPEGQRTCSMCYGDVDHGKDGYYRDWLEQDWRDQEAKQDEASHTPDHPAAAGKEAR